MTIPLRRFLHRKEPPAGVTPEREACWDLHVIPLRGRPSLLAVHCRSRYAFTLFDLTGPEWEDLAGTFSSGLGQSLEHAGFPEEAVKGYLLRAGTAEFTKTHGRREVAFLNRAWEDVLAADFALDPAGRAQPLLDHAVNGRPSRCAGYEGLAPAIERMGLSLG